MAEIATINGISPSAISTINGVSISAIDTINGCTPGEGGVPETGVFLTIDSDYIDADLTNMPVGVVLDSSVAMLAGLGSTDWRYLHATSGGYELFVEVDVWDMTAPLAVLWIRCPSLLSSSDTVVKLEITSELNDFFVVASARNWDTFDGTDGDPPNFGLWRYIETGTDFTIQSNALQADHTAIETVSLKSWAALSGDFDIQIDFDILTGPSTLKWAFQFLVTTTDAASDDHALIDRRYDGTHKFFSNIAVGGGEDQTSTTTSVTSGKLRIIRSGSNLGVWYYDTDWQNPNSNASFTTADVYIMLRSVTTTAITFSAAFDNLIINSCDSITGFIGETTDDAAQVVWDSDFAGVWHMSQDPSVSDILDSTSNSNNGTPNGSMTSGDLVDGDGWKALDFDGSNDYISIPHNSIFNVSNITMEIYFNFTNKDTNEYPRLLYKNTLGSTSTPFEIMYHEINNWMRVGLTDSVGTVHSIAMSDVSSGTWYYIAATFDGSDRIGYLDGSVITSLTEAFTLGTNTNSILIGAGEIDRFMYGKIACVRISSTARSAAWIKVTAQNLLGNLVTISEVQPTIKYATIDSTLIDSDLTNFPIGIRITATDGLVNGLGTTDYEGFHFTIGGVECYAEVDVWEPDNGSAVIWVRCPTVTSSADTVVKIQNVGDDNTAYVGVTGSTPAQTVWTNNFYGVFHLSADAVNASGNTADGILNGSPVFESDDICHYIHFDGVNDSITRTLALSGDFTVNFLYNRQVAVAALKTIINNNTTGAGVVYIGAFPTNTLAIDYDTATTDYVNPAYTTPLDDWAHIAIVRSGTTLSLYVNGTFSESGTIVSDAVTFTHIGYRPSSTDQHEYYLSHLTFDTEVRSAAWIKATAQNLLGNLVTIS